MNKQDSDYYDLAHGITRRRFIGTAAGGSAALLTGGLASLLQSTVSADAPLIQKLRAAGAIILGKANLGEWANFRDDEAETYPLAVGWSARGGSTNNAYDLSYTSWGSSSGSGAGAAANLCAAAVGTETDGSITGPSAVENIFGLKPTLGLISQDGIVPI